MHTIEHTAVTLYYNLLGNMEDAQAQAMPQIALLKKEMQLFSDALSDDTVRLTALAAKLQAVQQSHNCAAFAQHLYEEYHNDLNTDGFRKWEEHAEIQSVITWLQQSGITDVKPLPEQQYSEQKAAMLTELVQACYRNMAISYLQNLIWRLEGRMALQAGVKADTGLRWNLTAKPPFTKTDFENLVSALWEMKFITHTTAKKEHAIKALYGVFDLPVPEKTGTNRHKAKSAGTTTDKSYEIFDRLKAAHQQYLDRVIR